MPFYKQSDMKETSLPEQPMGIFKGLPGELLIVGFATYPKGKISRPHYHPREEQFVYILEGRRYLILGEEEGIVGPGDLVHIPRSTVHGGIVLDEKTVLFAVKSPSGNGNLAQDHNDAKNADEITERLKSKYNELSGDYLKN